MKDRKSNPVYRGRRSGGTKVAHIFCKRKFRGKQIYPCQNAKPSQEKKKVA